MFVLEDIKLKFSFPLSNIVQMAKNMFVMLVLVVAVGSMVSIVLGASINQPYPECSVSLGFCNQFGIECDVFCKSLHPNGRGYCFYNVCYCHYYCGNPPSSN
ncbi:hypothetical protein Lalb_Chr08g0231641 [Lupinus albus]|uniref:Knottin, scorpion toxin n=1 Tax=Lupinus albus TaxID=3870 RepID=A0A6A4Q307_LUPAL|nr:hypothetical protein Lalb_Chr08g0231641 [Lupinus albus]